MDCSVEAVREKLAAEFPRQPGATVTRVVSQCVDEFPDGDGLLIEQAVRAHLTTGGAL
jgi:hypothetical protein